MIINTEKTICAYQLQGGDKSLGIPRHRIGGPPSRSTVAAARAESTAGTTPDMAILYNCAILIYIYIVDV